MHDKDAEIYAIIIFGSLIGLVLIGFIVTMLFLYQRRRYMQQQEMAKLKDDLEQESLRSQLEIQEMTFKAIAQELHDNIGQVLSVVKLTLAVLPIDKEHPAYEPISNARQIMNKAIFDLADLTKSLHTDRIVQIGLISAIQYEVESVRKAGILNLQLHITGNDVNFDEKKSIFLFRMFQEIINNILKHSHAREANIYVDYSADNIFTLSVVDDGVGFDPEETRVLPSSSSGVGLKSMANRAKLIGADFSIKSQPGKGTNVTIRLPLTTNETV